MGCREDWTSTFPLYLNYLFYVLKLVQQFWVICLQLSIIFNILQLSHNNIRRFPWWLSLLRTITLEKYVVSQINTDTKKNQKGKSHLFSITTLNIQCKTLWIPNAVNVLSHQTNSPQCTTAQQIKYNSPKHFLSASKLPAFCSSMFYLTYPPIPLQSYHLFNPCRSTM